MKLSDSELNKLDSWRGLLSLIVLIAHTIQIFWFPFIGLNNFFSILIPTLTNLTVVAFFSLSGIVISYSIKNQVRKNDFNWRLFLFNRFSRIYPNLIASIILSVLLFLLYKYINNNDPSILLFSSDKYIARKYFEIDLKSIFQAILMLHPGLSSVNGSLWSLYIEWWLYISSIFIIGSWKNNQLKISAIFTIIPFFFTYYNFGVASIFYIFIWYIAFFHSFILAKINTLILISFIILIFLLLYSGPSMFLIQKANFITYGIFQISFSLSFLKMCFRLPVIGIFSKISKFSYTIYLIHFPILLFSFAISRNWINGSIIFNFTLSLIVLFFIIIFSKYLALFTENKTYHRDLLRRYFNIR